MRNVSHKVTEKIKTRILYATTLYQKLFRLCDNVDKYVTARQGTDNNKTRRRKDARIQIHTHNIQLLLFHGSNGYANVPERYVTRIVPVLSHLPSAMLIFQNEIVLVLN
jgi:hypothetical protein